MQYIQRTFTLPSGSQRTSQRQWDFTFLTKEAFLAKYGHKAPEYVPPATTAT